MSTTTTMLTSQERVNRAMNHQDHDRIPRHDTYWGETITRWQNEGLNGDAQQALKLLCSDMQSVGGSWPSAFPRRHEQVSEDQQTSTYIDEWGSVVRYWKSQTGTPEHISFGCETREIWEKTYKPIYLKYALNLDAQKIRNDYAAARKAGKWCFLTGLESIEALRKLLGDVDSMMGMAEDPDWIIDISRTYTDALLRGLDQYMTMGIKPDGLWVYGDMAYNHATMCSPQMYRDLIWPDHKRIADWAHTHDMKFIFHTDGDINGVLDLYQEAGFDCLQPLEAKANMDIRRIGPTHGKTFTYFGNIDAMVLGTNDKAQIEAEVRSKLAAGMANHGYIYHSDHSVPPGVSLETYRYVIELLNQYGNYA
jgi:uroporphyrinogen decarboxylase